MAGQYFTMNGVTYEVLTGGTTAAVAPVYNPIPGSETIDGTAVLVALAAPPGATPGAGVATYFRKKDLAIPDDGSSIVYHDVIFQVLENGTTSDADVEYNYAVGSETTDGTLVVLATEAWSRFGQVATVVNNVTFAATWPYGADPREINGWFNDGILTWETGQNVGLSMEVQASAVSQVTSTSASSVVLWSTNTSGVFPVGSSVVAMATNTNWGPNTSVTSPSGNVQLQFQTDGNLVVVNTQDSSVIWGTNIENEGATLLSMQVSDGNLVIYKAPASFGPPLVGGDPADSLLDVSGGPTKPGAYLVLYDDGNLTIEVAETAISTTNTGSDISLYLPMGYAVQPGDRFRVYAGCSKLIGVTPSVLQTVSVYGTFPGTDLTITDPNGCFPKFQNAVNFRGEPFIPGVDFLVGTVALNQPGYSAQGSKK